MGECIQLRLNLVFEENKGELPQKEDNYVPPDYMKFYTVYQYDRFKFKDKLRAAVKKKKPKNEKEFKELQDRILLKCYIRDEKGKRKRDTDEKHIFRYKALENIYSELYDRLGQRAENIGSLFFGAKEIILYPEDEQAEIKNTWNLPVLERVKMHIELIKEIKKSAKVAQNSSYDI